MARRKPTEAPGGLPTVTPEILAGEATKLLSKAPSLMVPLYLMASYLYYVHDISMYPDAFFDAMCKRLLEVYDAIDHRHKAWVDRDSLQAGTGYAIKFAYMPFILIDGAYRIARRLGEDLGEPPLGPTRCYDADGNTCPPPDTP